MFAVVRRSIHGPRTTVTYDSSQRPQQPVGPLDFVTIGTSHFVDGALMPAQSCGIVGLGRETGNEQSFDVAQRIIVSQLGRYQKVLQCNFVVSDIPFYTAKVESGGNIATHCRRLIMTECLGSVSPHILSHHVRNAKIVVCIFEPELGGTLVQLDGPRHVLLQTEQSSLILTSQKVHCNRITCVDSLLDHGEALAVIIWSGRSAEWTVIHATFDSCQITAVAHCRHAAHPKY
mmetsp:Transcript_2054/g.4238  ORF Transcript_2054/g.4238 Transcript_2054/m.4238 type:complete len:232 (-) Transcript_2054:53-748(-)